MSRRLRQRLSCYFERAGVPVRKRELLFFERPLESAPEPPACGAAIDVLSAGDLARLDYCGGWLTREAATRKLNAGSCFLIGAHDAGRLVGYTWCESGTAYLDFFDLELPLPEATVYRAHSFVHPHARNRGIWQAMNARLLAEARARGARRICFCMDPNNAPMLNLQAKLGVRHYLAASYLRLGPWRRYRLVTAVAGERLVTRSPAEAGKALIRFGSALA